MIAGFIVMPCSGGAQAKGTQSQVWQVQAVKSIVNDPAVSKGLKDLKIYQGCKYKIKNVENSAKLEKLLKHGLAALQLNRAYVNGFLDYFSYREQPTDGNKTAFFNSLKTLNLAINSYKENHQHYKLIGIFTFLDLAERVIKDIEKAERV